MIFVPQIKDLVKFKAKVLGEEYQGENYSGAIPFGNGLFKKPDSEKWPGITHFKISLLQMKIWYIFHIKPELSQIQYAEL